MQAVFLPTLSSGKGGSGYNAKVGEEVIKVSKDVEFTLKFLRRKLKLPPLVRLSSILLCIFQGQENKIFGKDIPSSFQYNIQ